MNTFGVKELKDFRKKIGMLEIIALFLNWNLKHLNT
jgi:hypothetical protein